MIENKMKLLIASCICTVVVACHSPDKAVSHPEGWQVIAFECTYIVAGGLERLSIDGENFEHMREEQRRGQRMRTIIKGSADEATAQVISISPMGQEQYGPSVPLSRSKAQKLFAEYKANYFLLSKFPSDKSLENILTQKYGKLERQLLFCNRRAYRFTRGRQVVVVDARTGIQLAVYQTAATGAPQTTKQLLHARWDLRRGWTRGYYKIDCKELR